jgi:small ligand-binding sensory domain FIST
LFLGIAMNEYQERFERGDFLIANVLGADQRTGAVAIGNTVRTGQTVQFHLRDAAAADEDLVQLLARDKAQRVRPPAAGLLFSCNGRGTRMFPEPNHDAAAVQRLLGPLPLAGIFAQGELGPVGGRNYIHGFTASLALFEEA